MMVSQLLDIQLSHHRGILTTLKTTMGFGVASFLPSLPPSSNPPRYLRRSKMDDSANVDLIDASPIGGGPDRFQISAEQLWRTGEAHDSDAENGANSCHGSPHWLPHPSHNLRRLKHLTLDTNLPPPFVFSSNYPTTANSTPLSSSHPFDYFDLGGEGLLPPAKVAEDMGFPHLLIYVRKVPLVEPVTNCCSADLPNHNQGLDDFDDAYGWDLHSRFSPFWDDGYDSDASEPSDEATDYITFTGQSVSTPPELEQTVGRFDLPEPSPFALDFPEDVGDSLEHDAILSDGDQGAISHHGRSTPVPTSEISVELLVQPPEDFPTPSALPSDILLPRIRRLSRDSDELEPPYPGLDVVDVPVNVPLSPFVTDGFLNDPASPPSDFGSGVEEISMETDWLGASRGDMIWSGCLGGELIEWDRWCGEVIDELNRDLGSWAEVRDSARIELDRV